VCRQTNKKDFKKKLKDLERRTNEKGKGFLKELMDEKEKWALAYDKGGKRCGYMTSIMADIFNSILRGVWSLPITAITSFIFYKCNGWFVKWLVDAQMVQTHHFDYVVAPNIYLDIKRYEAYAQVMHATCFDIQARKYEVIEGGGTTSGGEHRGAKRFTVNLSENTCTCGVPQLIHVPRHHVPREWSQTDQEDRRPTVGYHWDVVVMPHATQACVYIEYNNELDALMTSSVSTCYSFPSVVSL
jgi:hypothetical protein